MLRSDLIEKLTEELDCYKRSDVEHMVKCLIDCIAESLASPPHRIEIRNAFSLAFKRRTNKSARNPRTGEPLITAKDSFRLKPSRKWRELIAKDVHE